MNTRTHWFWTIVALLLVTGIYGAVIRLPFFSDDVIHFRGSSQSSATEILTEVQVGAYYLNYYRPVVNLVLYAAWELGISPSAPVWHSIILFNHLINMILVVVLLRELRFSQTVQLVAMLVFGVFPFNYQVVVWVLAWFHALVLTAILISCIAALRYFQNPQRYGWLLVAWVVGGIAPFIHENGVLVGVLTMLFLAYVHRENLTVWRIGFVVLPVFGMTLLYIYLWNDIANIHLEEKFGLGNLAHLGFLALFGAVISQTQRRNDWLTYKFNFSWKWLLLLLAVAFIWNLRGTGLWTSVSPRAAYFGQGMAFPLQALLPNTGNPIMMALFGECLFAGMLLVVWWLSPSLRWGLGLSITWFGIAILPAMVWLDTGYIASSPRLFYVSSPAVALCFGLVVDMGFKKGTWLRWLTAGILLATLAVSTSYIRDRIALYQTLGAAYTDFLQALPEATGTRIVVVNAPRWLAPDQIYFPLDHMGAVFVPDYFPLEDFIWLNTGRDYSRIHTVSHPASLYWQSRSTAIGESVESDTLPLNQWVYAFELAEKTLRCRRIN